MIRKLTPNEYVVSSWSGGTTTQLAIFPPEAVYARRDFLWRISSAAVELEESDFTALPDYERLISTLAGEMLLSHNGGPELRLEPFRVHAFSGAEATHSRGRCTDFNLMLRRGRAAGSMEALRLKETPVSLSVGPGTAVPPPPFDETLLLYCVEGTASVGAVIGRPAEETASVGAVIGRPAEETASVGAVIGCPCEAMPGDTPAGTGAACPPPDTTLAPGESLLVTEPAALTLSGPATVMLCRVKAV